MLVKHTLKLLEFKVKKKDVIAYLDIKTIFNSM